MSKRGVSDKMEMTPNELLDSFNKWFNERHADVATANIPVALSMGLRNMCQEAFEAGHRAANKEK